MRILVRISGAHAGSRCAFEKFRAPLAIPALDSKAMAGCNVSGHGCGEDQVCVPVLLFLPAFKWSL